LTISQQEKIDKETILKYAAKLRSAIL